MNKAWYLTCAWTSIIGCKTPTDDTSVDAPASAKAPGDLDGDGVLDAVDNCLDIYNPDQLDWDKGVGPDGFGNACDADYDDDGCVGMLDYGTFGAVFGLAGSFAQDHDGNGVVGFPDLILLLRYWGNTDCL